MTSPRAWRGANPVRFSWFSVCKRYQPNSENRLTPGTRMRRMERININDTIPTAVAYES
jgi:hypothetical protein